MHVNVPKLNQESERRCEALKAMIMREDAERNWCVCKYVGSTRSIRLVARACEPRGSAVSLRTERSSVVIFDHSACSRKSMVVRPLSSAMSLKSCDM